MCNGENVCVAPWSVNHGLSYSQYNIHKLTNLQQYEQINPRFSSRLKRVIIENILDFEYNVSVKTHYSIRKKKNHRQYRIIIKCTVHTLRIFTSHYFIPENICRCFITTVPGGQTTSAGSGLRLNCGKKHLPLISLG